MNNSLFVFVLGLTFGYVIGFVNHVQVFTS